MPDHPYSHELEAFQALLEGHRFDPDDELLFEDLGKARAAMEVAWLRMAGCSPGADSTEPNEGAQ